MPARERSIEQLRSYLREEVSAVESYHHVLEESECIRHEGVRARLEECRRDHERRQALLRQRIEALGAMLKERAGRGTGFAHVAQAGSKRLTERSTVEALQEGEDWELQDYERGLEALDEEDRRFVEQELLPAQRYTLQVVSRLKDTLH